MKCEQCSHIETGRGAFCPKCGAKLIAITTTKKLSPLNHLAAVPVVALAFVFCIGLLIILTARVGLGESAILGNLRSVNFATLEVGQMLDFGSQAHPRSTPLDEWVLSELHPRIIRTHNITRRDLENLINRLPIAEFMEDKLIRYGQGILRGVGSTNVNERDIIHFIQRNEHLFYRELGAEFSPRDYDYVRDALYDMDIGHLSRLDTLLGRDNVTRLQWALSWVAVAGLAVITLMLFAIIFLILKRQARLLLAYIGAITVAAGVLFLVPMFGLNALVIGMIPTEVDERLVIGVLSGMRSIGMTMGLVAAIVGILLAMISMLMGILQKASHKNKQRSDSNGM